jgi:hypothetical protein
MRQSLAAQVGPDQELEARSAIVRSKKQCFASIDDLMGSAQSWDSRDPKRGPF